MTGIIILWYGSIANIPLGWHLCDGNDGTVDLRNVFVPHKGPGNPPGTTGGHFSHVHMMFGSGHGHFLLGAPVIGLGIGFDFFLIPTTVTATSDRGIHFPPYHALCYIQKI